MAYKEMDLTKTVKTQSAETPFGVVVELFQIGNPRPSMTVAFFPTREERVDFISKLAEESDGRARVERFINPEEKFDLAQTAKRVVAWADQETIKPASVTLLDGKTYTIEALRQIAKEAR